ncbi:hypothetical protein AwWohl_09340 [Gammaproteobacteria bacterium]|nr:hypothetical protein AwWohl_09340 [Gammaproteobacteria bacterium]
MIWFMSFIILSVSFLMLDFPIIELLLASIALSFVNYFAHLFTLKQVKSEIKKQLEKMQNPDQANLLAEEEEEEELTAVAPPPILAMLSIPTQTQEPPLDEIIKLDKIAIPDINLNLDISPQLKLDIPPLDIPPQILLPEIAIQVPVDTIDYKRIQQIWDKAWLWLKGANILVIIGVVILFLGVSFLLKAIVSRGLFPLGLRYIFVAIGAASLLGIGWYLRNKVRGYALILQGGGIGLLYLLLFSAHRLHEVIPRMEIAFGLMFIVCAFSVFLALLQDARTLAFMGSMGGFLAPVLISSNSDNYVGLFSYYAILNSGICVIAYFKSWRSLNLLGFVFTLCIGATWGVNNYTAAKFATTEPFLILFFLFYVGIGINYAKQQALEIFSNPQHQEYKRYIDGTLIFGVPLAFMLLQNGLLKDTQYGMAYSSCALACLYFSLAYYFRAEIKGQLKLLFESLLGLGILFATLAIPLALEGNLTGTIWAVEGALILWVSLRQRHLFGLVTGIALQIIAGIILFISLNDLSYLQIQENKEMFIPFLNSHYIGILMLTIAGIFSGWNLQSAQFKEWLVQKIGQENSDYFPNAVGLWGFTWWLGGNIYNMDLYILSTLMQLQISLILIITTTWIVFGLAQGFKQIHGWQQARYIGILQTPALIFIFALWANSFIAQYIQLSQLPFPAPLSIFSGALIWMLALSSNYIWLYKQQTLLFSNWESKITKLWHILSFWLICGLIGLQVMRIIQIYEIHSMQRFYVIGLYLAILLLTLLHVSKLKLLSKWLTNYMHEYVLITALPLLCGCLLWSLTSLKYAGDGLFTAFNLTQIIVFIAIWQWLLEMRKLLGLKYAQKILYIFVAIIFVWLNATLLRGLNHYMGIDYSLVSMANNLSTQMYFIGLWSMIVLGVVLWSIKSKNQNQNDENDEQKSLPSILSVPILLKLITPLTITLWFWSVYTSFAREAIDWAGIPLLNCLDALIITINILFFAWLNCAKAINWLDDIRLKMQLIGIAGLFLWLNAALLRGLHHYMGIDYSLVRMTNNLGTQMYFIGLWCIIVLGVVLWSIKSKNQNQNQNHENDEQESLPSLLSVPNLLKLITPLTITLWGWSVYANFAKEGIEWAGIPLLNCLDALIITINILFFAWLNRAKAVNWLDDIRLKMQLICAAGLFLWLNAFMIRTLHHALGLTYSFRVLIASMPVQAALSLLWGSLALIMMIIAVKRALRSLWFVGIGLIILTVGKLFLVELANIGGTARIISFIGVGVLLLIIGYFAPLPPENTDQEEVDDDLVADNLDTRD